MSQFMHWDTFPRQGKKPRYEKKPENVDVQIILEWLQKQERDIFHHEWRKNKLSSSAESWKFLSVSEEEKRVEKGVNFN